MDGAVEIALATLLGMPAPLFTTSYCVSLDEMKLAFVTTTISRRDVRF